MTPAPLALYRGLSLAAHAAAHMARAARQAQDMPEYLNRSQQAAWLAEEARIVRGDAEALADRAERVLEAEFMRERWVEQQVRFRRREMERDALAGAMAAMRASP